MRFSNVSQDVSFSLVLESEIVITAMFIGTKSKEVSIGITY